MEYQNYGKVQIRLYFVAYCTDQVRNRKYQRNYDETLVSLKKGAPRDVFHVPNRVPPNTDHIMLPLG